MGGDFLKGFLKIVVFIVVLITVAFFSDCMGVDDFDVTENVNRNFMEDFMLSPKVDQDSDGDFEKKERRIIEYRIEKPELKLL